MSDRTRIEWTDATWNPITGCSKISPGCQHCYAERLSHRFGWTTAPWTAPQAAANIRWHPDRLRQPSSWRKPRRIFVNSLSDLFHDAIPDAFLADVFAAMARCEVPGHPGHLRHVFQILTKRPRRMQRWMTALVDAADAPDSQAMGSPLAIAAQQLAQAAGDPDPAATAVRALEWVRDGLPGLWIGVSVEDQRRADERIPWLQTTPAAIRFVSCEPLLGPVDLTPYLPHRPHRGPGSHDGFCTVCGHLPSWHGTDVRWIDWVIVGAESGPQARPMDDAWVRDLRDQCVAAGVPFFFKQRAVRGRKVSQPVLDGQIWQQWPTG
jgi:protein gp37